MKRVIGLTYDSKKDYTSKEGDPQDVHAEFDFEATIDNIADALRAGGNEVVKIGNVTHLLEKIDNLCVDIVFNLSEGLGGRNRESQVPIILEMKGIPYVGSDGLTLALTLDKIMAKKIMCSESIPTPNSAEVSSLANLNGQLNHLQFPLIVKPRHEGSSMGITQDSKVDNTDKLKKRIDFIVNTYDQAALIEEFIIGREFTVGLIGNDSIQVLPPVQIKIDGKLDLGEQFYTFGHITSDSLEYICPAQISKELNQEICELALKTYRALECKDFGRVDIRVDKKGKPFVLEVNPLPSLAADDIFMIVAKELNISFPEIINMILGAALKRYNMN